MWNKLKIDQIICHKFKIKENKIKKFAEEENSDESTEEYDENYDSNKPVKDNKEYQIQMFGINEQGETASILVNGFKPYFYVRVGDDWKEAKRIKFIQHIKQEISKTGRSKKKSDWREVDYNESIVESKLIEKKNLYGFDQGAKYNFVVIKFSNVIAMNKVKNLWYTQGGVDPETGRRQQKLNKLGLMFEYESTKIYEANIPPLLRYFHVWFTEEPCAQFHRK